MRKLLATILCAAMVLAFIPAAATPEAKAAGETINMSWDDTVLDLAYTVDFDGTDGFYSPAVKFLNNSTSGVANIGDYYDVDYDGGSVTVTGKGGSAPNQYTAVWGGNIAPLTASYPDKYAVTFKINNSAVDGAKTEVGVASWSPTTVGTGTGWYLMSNYNGTVDGDPGIAKIVYGLNATKWNHAGNASGYGMYDADGMAALCDSDNWDGDGFVEIKYEFVSAATASQGRTFGYVKTASGDWVLFADRGSTAAAPTASSLNNNLFMGFWFAAESPECNFTIKDVKIWAADGQRATTYPPYKMDNNKYVYIADDGGLSAGDLSADMALAIEQAGGSSAVTPGTFVTVTDNGNGTYDFDLGDAGVFTVGEVPDAPALTTLDSITSPTDDATLNKVYTVDFERNDGIFTFAPRSITNCTAAETGYTMTADGGSMRIQGTTGGIGAWDGKVTGLNTVAGAANPDHYAITMKIKNVGAHYLGFGGWEPASTGMNAGGFYLYSQFNGGTATNSVAYAINSSTLYKAQANTGVAAGVTAMNEDPNYTDGDGFVTVLGEFCGATTASQGWTAFYVRDRVGNWTLFASRKNGLGSSTINTTLNNNQNMWLVLSAIDADTDVTVKDVEFWSLNERYAAVNFTYNAKDFHITDLGGFDAATAQTKAQAAIDELGIANVADDALITLEDVGSGYVDVTVGGVIVHLAPAVPVTDGMTLAKTLNFNTLSLTAYEIAGYADAAPVTFEENGEATTGFDVTVVNDGAGLHVQGNGTFASGEHHGLWTAPAGVNAYMGEKVVMKFKIKNDQASAGGHVFVGGWWNGSMEQWANFGVRSGFTNKTPSGGNLASLRYCNSNTSGTNLATAYAAITPELDGDGYMTAIIVYEAKDGWQSNVNSGNNGVMKFYAVTAGGVETLVGQRDFRANRWDEMLFQLASQYPAQTNFTIKDVQYYVEADPGDAAPTFTDYAVTLGEDISFKFYAPMTMRQQHDAYVEFDMDTEDSGDKASTVATKSVGYDPTLGKFYAVYTGITPQCMGDTVTADLYVGGVKVDTISATVADYLEAYAAANASSADLIGALAVYGDAARDYTGYGTAKSPLVTEIGQETATAGKPDSGLAKTQGASSMAGSLEITGTRLFYSNKPILAIKVNNTATAGAYLKCGDEKVADVETGVNEYKVLALAAGLINQNYTFTLYDGEDNLVQTLVYGVPAAAYGWWDLGTSPNYVALVKALYTYGVEAAAYLA